MTSDKTFKFRQQWRSLETKQADLDYERCKFSYELRQEFSNGAPGDSLFIAWCGTELGLSATAAQELLDRGAVYRIAGSKTQLRDLGGFHSVRTVLSVQPSMRTVAVERAKASNKTVRTVVAELVNTKPAEKKPSVYTDLVTLCTYLKGTSGLPKNIEAIIKRYL